MRESVDLRISIEKFSRVQKQVTKLTDLQTELDRKVEATATIEAAKQETERLKIELAKQRKRDRAMSNQPKVDYGENDGAQVVGGGGYEDMFDVGDGYTGR